LIIIAKPINRLKIILTKFAVILSVCFLIVLIGSVFIVSAGKWDHKLAVTLTHFILATLVIFLLFSSIAIMMNIFTGKIGILCTTIGLAILISVMHLTIPLTVKTQGDYLKEKYGLNFISRPLMVNHPDGPEMIDTVGLNVFSETNSTKALINYVDQKTNGVAETYFDIGGQINKMFFADNDEHHSFN
jgi:ABC-type transport system involved in multi-copper enzyme maturation permease subunit